MSGIPYPLNDIDADIGTYISRHSDNNYMDVIRKDTRLEISRYLSDIPNGLFAWYPFENNAEVLVVGGQFGAFLNSISRRCKNVVVVEKDEYRAHFTNKRFSNAKNVTVYNSDFIDYQRQSNYDFDYIIWAIDETIDTLSKNDYENYFLKMKSLLKARGKILAVIPNRIGVRYFCGERDTKSTIPFEGITDDHCGIYRFSRDELLSFLKDISLNSIKLYYPLPDARNVQLIYTDQYPPGSEIKERIKVYVSRNSERLLSEYKLFNIFAENKVTATFSNHFIVECGNNVELSNVLYSAISSDRSRNRSFATNICSDGKVRKVPIYDEGVLGIEILKRNAAEQINRQIPSVKISIENNIAVMDKIEAPTLSNYIRTLVNDKDNYAVLKCMDMLYKYIINSSEYTSDNGLSKLNENADWGPVLKKAYIEMIPVNCFFIDGDLLFFDQEYTMDNCPAGYVMFRAVNDIYNFVPKIRKLISFEEMQSRYNLKNLWSYYLKVENDFCRKLINEDIYLGRTIWEEDNDKILRNNRRGIKMSSDSVLRLYNPVLDLKDKKLILFGAGKNADYFMDKYGDKYKVDFIIDNNSEKWGTEKRGIAIKSPEVIHSLIYGTYRIVIAIANYEPIIEQLNSMGLDESSYRIFDRTIDDLLFLALSDAKSEGKYNIGYVTGAFDLFHIGHLNLLKRCKERCHYLIAGVLTDEIIEKEKHKTPFIPFEERIEIISQCKYVDRAIPVDKHNTNKIDAWKELRYGCLFSGSDHQGEPYWMTLQSKLRTLGSDLEFFPYTKSTSSTMLQKAIKDHLKE
jgi:cytidyltransferase-like protein